MSLPAFSPSVAPNIELGRDVIKQPIEGDWDIRKALGLLIKPNPVMLEWLSILILKSAAKEIGRGARIPMIDAFIHDQITWSEVVAKQDERPDLIDEGDLLLRAVVKGAFDA